MSDRLPERVNPFRLAEVGRRLEGRLALSRFRRLEPSLASTDGEVEVRLGFSRNAQGLTLIRGEIEATLELECQRCLRPMAFRIEREVAIAAVTGDAEAALVQEQYDPQIVEDESLVLLDLVEDELLLAIPLAPMHTELQACQERNLKEFDPEAEAREEGQKESPFAVLKKLKPN